MTGRVEDAVKRQKSRRRLLASACGLVLRSFMMAVVVGAALAGMLELWRRALADPRFRFDGETLALAGAVRECPESVDELVAIGRRFHGRNLLDPWLVGDMEAAYSANRWVRKVVFLRRQLPNRIDMQFLLRLPAVQVWHDNRYWLVDNEGALLPVAASPRMFPSLPEIVGVTPGVIANRPEAGGMWRDEGVEGALGVIRCIWGSPLGEAFPVARVVVTTGAGRDAKARRRFEVVSTQGYVARWGAFNPGDIEGELTSAEKLRNLEGLMRRREAGRRDVCFDVRTSLPGYSLLPEG